MLTAAGDAAAALAEAADAGRPLDVDSLLMVEALDVLGRVMFQADLLSSSAGKPDLLESLSEGLAELNARFANPLRKWLFFLPSLRRRAVLWREFQRRMEGLLASLRARGPPADDDNSIAAHLLRLRDPVTGGVMPDERLLPELATLFIAGMDTTAHTMAWTLYLLSQHPEADARVAAELDSAGLLATPKQPCPRTLEWADLSGLPFLSACIKESLRLLPVSADGTAAQFDRPIYVEGYTIPADTPIWVHIYSIQNGSRHFDHPDQFLPERWLEPGAEYAREAKPAAESPATPEATAAAAAGPDLARLLVEEDGSLGAGGRDLRLAKRPLRLLPFSLGQRDCVGQSLAKMNYTFTLARLLGSFSFRLAEEVHGGLEGVPDVVRLTLQPEHGLWMHAVPRA